VLGFLKAVLAAVLACVLLASCDAAIGSETGDGQGRAQYKVHKQREKHHAKSDRKSSDRKSVEHRQRPTHSASRVHTTPKPAPRPRALPAPKTFLVTRVVDGDTLELGNGESVRLVGIDTPELGQCGYDRATAALARLVAGKQVRLGRSDEDRDRYGRLLRYVDVGGVDAGLRQIRSGMAIARYDSRDGYGFHPREPRYIAADRTSRSFACPKPAPAPQPLVGGGGACAPGYSPCVPPFPPDADCADVNGPVTVTGPDPHGLDGDGDGVACE
jgi:endonuclease YncB( thermonuclease family)